MEPSEAQQTMLRVGELAGHIERHLSTALSNIKGISLAEYRLVRALADAPKGQASRVGLAGAVGLTASGVTRALRPLEKLGYVETLKGDRDARLALASLTEHGEELVADASGVLNDSCTDLAVDGNESRDLLEVLARLAGVPAG